MTVSVVASHTDVRKAWTARSTSMAPTVHADLEAFRLQRTISCCMDLTTLPSLQTTMHFPRAPSTLTLNARCRW